MGSVFRISNPFSSNTDRNDTKKFTYSAANKINKMHQVKTNDEENNNLKTSYCNNQTPTNYTAVPLTSAHTILK